MKHSKVYKNIIALAGSCVLSLAALELSLRFFGYYKYFVAPDVAAGFWVPDKVLGWKNKPDHNISFYNTNQEFIEWKTDPYGFHTVISESKSHRPPVTIGLIGDSTVMGRSAKKRLPDFLVKMLSTKYPEFSFKVVSAAVEAYNLEQVYLSIDHLNSHHEPDFYIYGLCHNDIDDLGAEVMPGTSFLKPYLNQVDDSFVIALPDKLNSIATYNPNFIKVLVNQSVLYRIIRLNLPRFKQALLPQQATASANTFSPIDRRLNSKNVKKFNHLMRSIVKKTKSNFIWYIFPDPHESEPIFIADKDKYRFRSHVKSSITGEIHEDYYVEILDDFNAEKGGKAAHLLPFDHHNNSYGYELISKSLVKRLEGNKSFQQFMKK